MLQLMSLSTCSQAPSISSLGLKSCPGLQSLGAADNPWGYWAFAHVSSFAICLCQEELPCIIHLQQLLLTLKNPQWIRASSLWTSCWLPTCVFSQYLSHCLKWAGYRGWPPCIYESLPGVEFAFCRTVFLVPSTEQEPTSVCLIKGGSMCMCLKHTGRCSG